MLKRLAIALFGTLLLLAVALYAVVASSLPRRSGSAPVPGADAPIQIELDAHAIPRIQGQSFLDALRGQGYAHAQERYFQMDLLRRSSAGELAELFGERALGADTAQAPFDFRSRAHALLDSLPPEQKEWLDAYTQGVNAGLTDLRSRPPEYWLVGAKPAPWRAEDSLLVVLTFYTMLSNNDAYERAQGVMSATLAPAVYDFLTPSTSRFDRPLAVGPRDDATGGYVAAPIPGADVIDLRHRPHAPAGPLRVDPPLQGPASNQWAVDATRGAGGLAMLANDPHLGLRLPNVFYRAELAWPTGLVRGASIPGLPGILIGANATLAWGATVSNADQADWVVVETDPEDPRRYRTPEGLEAFATSTASIVVAGRREAVTVDRRSTRWGPVAAHDWLGRPLALRATWLDPEGLTLDIIGLADATTVEEGIGVVERWAGPSMNWMLADAMGDIGWAVNGPLPQRETFDGSRPESWRDGRRAWHGFAPSPSLQGRADGVLFTANNRTLPARDAAELSRMWMRPLRAKRIDDLLAAQRQFDERDFLAMQLDTAAEGYEPGLRRRIAWERRYVQAWNGNADADEPGFRILQAYYRALLDRALAPLLAPAIEADADFVYRWPLADESLRRLLEERPAHLLTQEYADWRVFLRTVLRETLERLERDPEHPGIGVPWGEANRLDVRHPFASQLGLLGEWLALPAVALPGSMVSLRVAAPTYGAVVRFSIAPAAPQNAILQMAGGQSGHFLSAQFRDLQSDWVDGTPTPFLAGPTVSRIMLTP